MSILVCSAHKPIVCLWTWNHSPCVIWTNVMILLWSLKSSCMLCIFVVAVSPRSSSVQWDFMCFSLYISIMSCMLRTAELMMKLRGRTEKTRRLFPAHRDKGATFRFCYGGQVLVAHQTLEFTKHTYNTVDILYI